MIVIAAGAIPGLIGAKLSGEFLESLVYGAKSVSLITSIGTLLFLAFIASTSIWTASRRIAKADIMLALRNE